MKIQSREHFAILHSRKAVSRSSLPLKLVAAVVVSVGLSGCGCKDLGNFTGAGNSEFPSSGGSCSTSPGGVSTVVVAIAAQALKDADAQARAKCTGILVRKKDPAEDIKSLGVNVHVYPKDANTCGISTTTTREYKCCDLPSGFETVPVATPTKTGE